MTALSTIFPVMFMVVLGLISRVKGFVTPEQKEGANGIVYNLKINIDMIGSLIKLLVTRIVFYVFVIGGVFILFPNLMAEKTYLIAILIYFMCPTGFVLPMQISSLFKSEEDSSFTSAFISLNMIVTLIVYAFVVVFIA